VRALFAKNKVRFARSEQVWFVQVIGVFVCELRVCVFEGME